LPLAMPTYLESVISALPDSPGVYQFYDKENKLLYIGKAKSLRKRVVSYFRDDNNLNGKTRIMVRKIADIKTLVVDSETDALLLENNLIKKHQPR
jgi:excinuclease ABC subunit C